MLPCRAICWILRTVALKICVVKQWWSIISVNTSNSKSWLHLRNVSNLTLPHTYNACWNTCEVLMTQDLFPLISCWSFLNKNEKISHTLWLTARIFIHLWCVIKCCELIRSICWGSKKLWTSWYSSSKSDSVWEFLFKPCFLRSTCHTFRCAKTFLICWRFSRCFSSFILSATMAVTAHNFPVPLLHNVSNWGWDQKSCARVFFFKMELH